MDLVRQARNGVALVIEQQKEQSQAQEELSRLQRLRLDEAFDADVEDRGVELTSDWVIEARKAYAAGLDAYARQRDARQRSDEALRRNLDAADAALQRLQWLQTRQLEWSIESFLGQAGGTKEGER